jgi:hypothetical protein
MKVISNTKLIKRNHKISTYITFAGLLFLVAAMITLNPFNVSSSADPNVILLSLGLMLVGIILSQVSMYYSNRFGRSPRPDERITSGLKGLDDRYQLYHFMTPVSHLLVGPAGIWILNPYNQRGTITYNLDRKRWNQKGTNIFFKLFGQEGIGRPDQDNYMLYQDLQKYIKKEMDIPNLPEPQVAMVFVDPRAVVTAPEAPIPAMSVEKLKDFIRKQAKDSMATFEIIQIFQKSLPQESIE